MNRSRREPTLLKRGGSGCRRRVEQGPDGHHPQAEEVDALAGQRPPELGQQRGLRPAVSEHAAVRDGQHPQVRSEAHSMGEPGVQPGVLDAAHDEA